jgi:hypothetical protein
MCVCFFIYTLILITVPRNELVQNRFNWQTGSGSASHKPLCHLYNRHVHDSFTGRSCVKGVLSETPDNSKVIFLNVLQGFHSSLDEHSSPLVHDAVLIVKELHMFCGTCYCHFHGNMVQVFLTSTKPPHRLWDTPCLISVCNGIFLTRGKSTWTWSLPITTIYCRS